MAGAIRCDTVHLVDTKAREGLCVPEEHAVTCRRMTVIHVVPEWERSRWGEFGTVLASHKICSNGGTRGMWMEHTELGAVQRARRGGHRERGAVGTGTEMQ